jgi:hypothetical protein
MALTSKSGRLAAGFAVMLVITIAMQLYLVPRIVDVGRTLDFIPRDPAPPQLSTFGILHAAYSALDLIKLLVGFWMAWCLLRSSSSQSEPLP